MNFNTNDNDREIINIREAEWFQTMDYCPSTLNQLKIFIDVMDRMQILKPYNLDLVVVMDRRRLDIIFALLKITNKFFNGYNEQLIRKILKPHLMKIFDIDKHSILMDQLIQDSESVITNYVTTSYSSNLSPPGLESILSLHLKQVLEGDFYKKAFVTYPISITDMVSDIVSYTIKSMKDIYITIHVFLSDVFSDDTEENRIDQLIGLILNNMNFEKILYDDCADIDMYNECYLNYVLDSKVNTNIQLKNELVYTL
jgi:hypothetical protein